MFIIKYKNLFIGVSVVLVLLAVGSLFVNGLKFGIDFTGGSISQIHYATSTPAIATVNEQVKSRGIEGALVQPTGDSGFIIRTTSLNQTQHDALINALSMDGKNPPIEDSFNDVGPSIGKELRSKAWVAIMVVILAIILFIAYVFRGVSDPVKSWKYGVIAIIALFHDVVIPTGVFAALGYQVDSLFVVALLAILGLSVNDTIVVFDRIRENLKLKISGDFGETVGKSLEQTFARSINTSLTIMVVLLALYFVGPDSTNHFALVLALGLFFGTYSSIFLASPLLVVLEQMQGREGKAKKKKR